MREAFRYSCTVCGTCCRWGGWACLYLEDIPRLAAFLGISLQDFVDTYTRHIAVEYVSRESTLVLPYLALKSAGDTCIFLENEKLCRVHPVKPAHCEASPFLAEFLLDNEGWEKLNAQCPGMGQGPLYDKAALRALLSLQAERDEAYEQALVSARFDLGVLLGVSLPEPEFIPDMGLDIELDEQT